MGGPATGDRPLTNAERQARWRDRHARKLARKAARASSQGPPTWESITGAFLTEADLAEMWGSHDG
jgi:hypothetical protein